MQLKPKSSKEDDVVFVPDELRKIEIYETTMRPMDIDLARKYFPSMFEDEKNRKKKSRLKPKK